MQKEVSPSGTLVGTLLGDACLPLYRGKPKVPTGPPTVRVEFEQKSASADYIWHLYDIFKDPVGILCWNTSASQ